MSKCIGCGIKLQSVNPDEAGYVSEIIVLENGEDVYCKRCHDIIHHNQLYVVDNDLRRYYQKICNIKNTKSLILLLIDVLDIYNGFIPNLSQYIGKNKVIVLVNKVDLLPKSVKLEKIKERVKEIALNQKLNIIRVMMISAKKESDIRQVIRKVVELKYDFKNRRKTYFNDCYVMGCASVGKSTFINSVSKYCLNGKTQVITTSDQFHTTVDMIKILFDEKSFIIDTPGIIDYGSIGAYLDYDSMKVLMPKTYLKPRTFQIRDQQTIFLGGLCRIDFVSGQNMSATFYVSNDLYIHRTKTSNVETLFEQQKYQLLSPPFTEQEGMRINQYQKKQYQIINRSEPKDLFISGIGFIHLLGDEMQIQVIIDQKITIRLEESIL